MPHADLQPGQTKESSSPKYSSRSVVMSNPGSADSRWKPSSQPGDVYNERTMGLFITAERDEYFLTTEDSEETKESQKCSIVPFSCISCISWLPITLATR